MANDEILLGPSSDGMTVFWIKDKFTLTGPYTRVVFARNENHFPLKGGVLSARNVIEVNCLLDTSRFMEFTRFTGPDLSGDVVAPSTSPSEWTYIIPGSPIEMMAKKVCIADGQSTPNQKRKTQKLKPKPKQPDMI